MYSSLASLDGYKLSWLITESLERLRFLLCVNKEDDTSSELAGYEINKLLSEQLKLEENYSELLKIRGTLKGISNKRRLGEIQKEVEDVVGALKDNTKKLGRLFRENPDLKREAEKVANERVRFVTKIGNILGPLQTVTPTFLPSQVDLISELEDQDSLRQLILKEKGLLSEIKHLHSILKNEEQIYQNDVNEKQMNVQTLKESLERGRSDAEVEIRNLQEGVDADRDKTRRLNNQSIIDLENAIEKIKEKKAVENQVFQRIANFLREKEVQKREEIQEWSTKAEEVKNQKQEKIDKLNEIKNKALEELKKLRDEYELRNGRRVEKEEKVIEREEEKRRLREEEERLDEAVKIIQERYRGWKEGGGTFKKKKKKKGAKKAKK